jgi:hypothetical protein
MGEEPNHTTARKPGPLKIIQYSLLHIHYIKIERSGFSDPYVAAQHSFGFCLFIAQSSCLARMTDSKENQ